MILNDAAIDVIREEVKFALAKMKFENMPTYQVITEIMLAVRRNWPKGKLCDGCGKKESK